MGRQRPFRPSEVDMLSAVAAQSGTGVLPVSDETERLAGRRPSHSFACPRGYLDRAFGPKQVHL
jgi:hypothetical protein